MSLVICSNQDSDAEAVTQKQSIFKPYSFRNALSSTYTIPKNSQVALQSVKYNLNGTFSVSGNSYVLYQYYGQTIDADVGETIQLNSTATPIRTPILDSDNDEVVELTADELATQLQSQMNKYIFHPNLVDLVTVLVKRDATTNEFEGFQIKYDQYNDPNTTIPSTSYAEDLNENVRITNDEDWTYDGSTGTFTSGEDPLYPQAIILPEYPLSAQNGSFVVDFSDPNDSNIDWAVGLSRYTQTALEGSGEYEPPYFTRGLGGDNQPSEDFFYDYLVCRKGDLLKVYHTPFDSSNQLVGDDYLHSVELDYSGYDVALDYNLSTNASNFEKVKFTLIGQQLRIQMIDDGDRVYDLYSYNSARVNASQLKVVCQPIQNLYPVLYLYSDDEDYGNELVIEQFTACLNLQNWRHDRSDSSYYQFCEITNNLDRCEEIEMRVWNDQNVADRDGYITYAGIKTGSNRVIDLENYLIFEPSEVYTPSTGANTTRLLGFTDSPTNNYDYGVSPTDTTTTRIFTSTTVPKLLSTKSMFVRLDNFTQQSTNARQGNRSNIIAHLPRFDGQVETGRIYHEPKNLIFLDLHNSQELKINSFDISFCYSNEQYVTALTGQSVVALYFRQKPS